jgi:hypothetical protein
LGPDGGWSAPKDESVAGALDPRTWSSELAEQEAPRPSSVRPPPMPRSSFRPPPLPELEDEEVDSDPEFLPEKGFDASGFEARPANASPQLADEFAPDDWRLPRAGHEPSASGAFMFGSPDVEPMPLAGYPASAPPPSSIERPVSDAGFNSALQSPFDVRPGATDAERQQPLSARVHHQAVRVALAPDPRTPGQFVLRALREREAPQNGERVALLVALEPGTPLV